MNHKQKTVSAVLSLLLIAGGVLWWYSAHTPTTHVLTPPESVAFGHTAVVEFSSAMDRDSVQKSLTVEDENLEKTVSWKDEKTLEVTFDEESDAESVSLLFETPLKDARGKTVEGPRKIEFFLAQETAELVFQQPEDGATKVSGMMPITLLWDTPVFALQNPEAAARALNEKIAILPPTPGAWQVLGTSGLLFEPSEPWKPSTKYTVAIPESTAGQDIAFSFETTRTVVTNMTANDLRLREPLTLRFNQAVSAQAVGEHIDVHTFDADGNPVPMLVRAQQGKKVIAPPIQPLPRMMESGQDDEAPEPETEPDPTAVELIPQQDWPADTKFEVVLPGDVRYSADGPLPMPQEYRNSFHTITPFVFHPERSQPPRYSRDTAQVCLSHAVEAATFFDHLTITPTPEEDVWEEYKQEMSQRTYNAPCMNVPAPGGRWPVAQEVTLTIDSDLKDIYDRPLGTAANMTFTTTLPHTVRPFYFPQSYLQDIFSTSEPLEMAFFYSGDMTGITATLTEEITGKSETKTFPVEGAYDAEQVLSFDIHEAFETLKPEGAAMLGAGRYALRITWPGRTTPQEETKGYDPYQNTELESKFYLTDFAVDMRLSAQQENETARTATATLRPLYDTPLPEDMAVELSFYNWDGKSTGTQTVDREEGDSISFTVPSQTRDIFVRLGNQTGIISENFQQGINPYEGNITFSPWQYSQNVRSSIFTDRPLYKPGDTLSFKSIVRELSLFEKAFPLKDVGDSPALKYEIHIKNPSWEDMMTFTGTTKDGALDGTWEIPDDVMLGQYILELTFPDRNSAYEQYPFYIGEFRKPTFLMDAGFDTEKALAGEEVHLDASAEYAFGGALAGADVRYTISLYGHEPCDWFCWHFARKDKTLATGNATLDGEGKLRVPVRLDFEVEEGEENIVWNLVNADITVIESPQEQSSLTVSVPYYASAYQLILTRGSTFYETGDDMEVKGAVTDLDDNAVEGARVKLTLLRRDFVRNDRKAADGNFYGEWREQEEIITEKTATTGQDGTFTGVFASPEKSGQYIVRAEVKDSQNRTTTREMSFWVWNENEETPQIRLKDENRILSLFPNKETYEVGEEVEIFFPHTQWEIEKAYASLERGTQLQELPIDIEGRTVRFTAESWMAPNVFTSVLLTGRDASGNPDLRWGSVSIEVKDPSRMLEVSITPGQEMYRPGQDAVLEIETTVEGAGVPAQVTIAVVDETLLALRSRTDISLWQKFLAQLPLGVTTSSTVANLVNRDDIRTILDQIQAVQDESAQMSMRGFGGGGGMAEKMGDFKPRGDFRDSAAFEANVQTDENGKATLTVPLPDNLTTWNVWAVGATPGNAFGEAETDFRVTLPLLVSPIMPNYFQMGDEMQVGVLIRRDTSEVAEESVEVTLALPRELGGGDEATQNTQTLVIGEEARVFFPLSVPFDPATAPINETEVEIGFFIEAESGAQDSVILKRNLLPPKTRTTVADFFRVAQDKKVRLVADARAVASRTWVRAFASVAEKLPTLIETIKERSYGCAEQTFAYFTALLTQQDLDRALGREVEKPDITELTHTRDELMTRYWKGQGIAFWPRETEPNLWLTLHMLEFAPQWNRAGAAFPKDKLETSAAWVKEEILRSCEEENYRCPSDTVRQHGAYVLAGYNRITPSDMGVLSQYTRSLESKAWWLRAVGALERGGQTLPPKVQTHRQDTQEDIARAMKASDRYIFWSEADGYASFFSQDERLSAIIFQLALEEDMLPDFHEKMARYLVETKRKYLSTNTSLRLLLAMSDYVTRYEGTPADIPVEVVRVSRESSDTLLSGTLESRDAELTATSSFADDAVETITFVAPEVGAYYAEVEQKEEFWAKDLQPIRKGFFLTQRIFALSDTERENPLTTLQTGQTYLVELEIVTGRPHRQVMVESPVASGTEGVNLDFENTDKTLTRSNAFTGGEGASDFCAGWCRPAITHQEFFHDKVRFFMDTLPGGSSTLTYFLQARLPGEYELLPPRVEEMYFPEVFATGKGVRLRVTE